MRRIGEMSPQQKAAIVRQKERILKKNGYRLKRTETGYTREYYYTWYAPDGKEVIWSWCKQPALNITYRHYLDSKVTEAESYLRSVD
jgi:hypothetical protein